MGRDECDGRGEVRREGMERGGGCSRTTCGVWCDSFGVSDPSTETKLVCTATRAVQCTVRGVTACSVGEDPKALPIARLLQVRPM